MWKNLYVSGSIGSEGGIVVADEEYKDACRITLEKCEKYCSVTCGVYGAMVHTAFADFDCGWKKYNEMKQELQRFIDADTTSDEELKFYIEFTNKF